MKKRLTFSPSLAGYLALLTRCPRGKEQTVQTVHTGHRQGLEKERKTRGNKRKVMISLTRIHL